MSSKKKSFFWATYADLMTSLFFVMLVLFIVSFITLNDVASNTTHTTDTINKQNKEIERLHEKNRELAEEVEKRQSENKSLVDNIKDLNEKIAKGEEINTAIKSIDNNYFEYDPNHKKHKLKIKVSFKKNSALITDISKDIRNELVNAGKALQRSINITTNRYDDIQYLLIIEGQASLDSYSRNYELSYERALALKNFWEKEGVNFQNSNCEVLISGSGDGKLSGTGYMREKNERDNQRFLIHIIPKPGILDVSEDKPSEYKRRLMY